jgi:hypothetical protein
LLPLNSEYFIFSFVPKYLNIKTYKFKFYVVSCGFETWSLRQREEYKSRVFENRGLRRIHGPKSKEGWRKIDTGEIHNIYCSPNTARVIKSVGMEYSTHGGDKKCVKISVGKHEGKRQLGPRI